MIASTLVVLVVPSGLTLVLQVLLGALLALSIYERRRAQKLTRAVAVILDELAEAKS